MPDIKPISEKEIDELDRYRAVYTLFSKLRASEARADKEEWVSADDVENGIKTTVETADTEYCIKISNTDIIICKVIRKVRDIIWNRIIMKKRI